MFKLEVDSVPMKVKFRHTQLDQPARKKLKRSAVTLALLVAPQGIVAHSEAWCSLRDQFSKETGRKLALSYLLADQFPGEQNKDLRKQFWDAYFSRH